MKVLIFDRELNSQELATLGKCLVGKKFMFVFSGSTSWTAPNYLATCKEWLQPRSEDFVLLPARRPISGEIVLPAIQTWFRHLIPFTENPERGHGGPRYNDYLWEIVGKGIVIAPNRPFPTMTLDRYMALTEGQLATEEWLDHEI